jgi:hypothetical protein
MRFMMSSCFVDVPPQANDQQRCMQQVKPAAEEARLNPAARPFSNFLSGLR